MLYHFFKLNHNADHGSNSSRWGVKNVYLFCTRTCRENGKLSACQMRNQGALCCRQYYWLLWLSIRLYSSNLRIIHIFFNGENLKDTEVDEDISLITLLQIFWHIDCSTFTALSFRIWNRSAGIPSLPVAFFVAMLPKTHKFLTPGCLTLAEVKWSEVTQSCPILCNPTDCSLPGSSIPGILQAGILEWGAIAFSCI